MHEKIVRMKELSRREKSTVQHPDKSYVSIGQKFCPICAEFFDDGTVLLDKRLANTMDKYTCVGVDLCPEHQSLVDSKEFCAFMVCKEGTQVQHRTGHGFLIRKEVADKMLNRDTAPINHCDMALMEKILYMSTQPEEVQ